MPRLPEEYPTHRRNAQGNHACGSRWGYTSPSNLGITCLKCLRIWEQEIRAHETAKLRTVYILHSEYQVGSDNGEVAEILGVYATREGAIEASRAWYAGHGLEEHEWAPSADEWEGEEEYQAALEYGVWCEGCGWCCEMEEHELLP